MDNNKQVWLPELIYRRRHVSIPTWPLVCNDSGHIESLVSHAATENAIQLNNRALLPGLVNAHSHAFQRVIRGRTEYRTANEKDSFWTWRESMYSAAARLTPEDLYDASRMAFLEMALSGITCCRRIPLFASRSKRKRLR